MTRFRTMPPPMAGDRRRCRRGARAGSQRGVHGPALIDAIKQAGVKAIFSEAQFPAKLVDQIAQSTGATVELNLYDDAIGDPPITSYEAIIRRDTDAFVKALR